MQRNEIHYLERRAAAETELAARAKHPAAVQAHYALSKLYFERAERLRVPEANGGGGLKRVS